MQPYANLNERGATNANNSTFITIDIGSLSVSRNLARQNGVNGPYDATISINICDTTRLTVQTINSATVSEATTQNLVTQHENVEAFAYEDRNVTQKFKTRSPLTLSPNLILKKNDVDSIGLIPIYHYKCRYDAKDRNSHEKIIYTRTNDVQVR